MLVFRSRLCWRSIIVLWSFKRMLGMRYSCLGIGDVQLMVGVRKCDKTKIQYCITALTPILRSKEKSSH